MSLEAYLKDYLQDYKPRGNDYSNLLHKPLFLVYLLGGYIKIEKSDDLNRVSIPGMPEMRDKELSTTALYKGFEYGLAKYTPVTSIKDLNEKIQLNAGFMYRLNDLKETIDKLMFHTGYAAARAFINTLKLKKEEPIEEESFKKTL